MIDEFTSSQWTQLCQRVREIADRLQRDRSEVEEFCDQQPPERYRDLLDRVRDAAHLAVAWKEDAHEMTDEQLIDEVGMESFPASDPPPFSHAHA